MRKGIILVGTPAEKNGHQQRRMDTNTEGTSAPVNGHYRTREWTLNRRKDIILVGTPAEKNGH